MPQSWPQDYEYARLLCDDAGHMFVHAFLLAKDMGIGNGFAHWKNLFTHFTDQIRALKRGFA